MMYLMLSTKKVMLIHNTDPIWGIYHFRPFLLRSVQGGIASTNGNQIGRKQNSLSQTHLANAGSMKQNPRHAVMTRVVSAR